MFDDFTGDLPLDTSSGAVSTSPVPTQQPDFNVAGANPNPTAILTALSGAVTSVAGAIGAVTTAQSTAQFNSAVAAQGQALALQQTQTAGKIAQLASATQLAQAQAAFNKAAGIIQPSSLMVVLAVATVILTAWALMRKKR